jgi:threonine synthase
LDPDKVTVAFITGTGLKTQEAVMDHLRHVETIQPNLAAFEATQLVRA